MTALHRLSAAELASLYARRKLSPVEAAEAAFARMDRWEPSINAMHLIHRASALESAKAAEKRWRKGRPLSAIDGVPITIKENLATRGDPSPIGTAGGSGEPKTEDSPIGARVRESGAVLLGKTTMPDLGMLSSGLSTFHGTTRNPWNVALNPAGSSSGAGAAAAAGYGPLHIGTDIGGSIRLPAHHCGLFGLKPSLGRLPTYPPYLGRVAGPMTRTVLDAAMLMGPLSGHDARDFMDLPRDDTDYVGKLKKLKLKGLRIGLLTEMGVGLAPHPAVIAAARDCAATLEEAGAKMEVMKSFLTPAMMDGWERFFEARSCYDIGLLPQDTRAKIMPYIVEWAEGRAKSFSGSDVIAAFGQIMAMREAAVSATARYDFVLTPPSPALSYSAEAASPTNNPRTTMQHIAFTLPYSVSEQPAASINWTFTREGLPVGVQVVGRRFDDLGVLRLSHAIETLRPKQRPWPEPA